jgi:hypothetical protein
MVDDLFDSGSKVRLSHRWTGLSIAAPDFRTGLAHKLNAGFSPGQRQPNK